IGAGRAGRHRYDSVTRRCQGLRQDSPDFDRGTAGGDDAADFDGIVSVFTLHGLKAVKQVVWVLTIPSKPAQVKTQRGSAPLESLSAECYASAAEVWVC